MALSSSLRSFSSTASLMNELRDFARPAATSFFARRSTSAGMLRATFAEFILLSYRRWSGTFKREAVRAVQLPRTAVHDEASWIELQYDAALALACRLVSLERKGV